MLKKMRGLILLFFLLVITIDLVNCAEQMIWGDALDEDSTAEDYLDFIQTNIQSSGTTSGTLPQGIDITINGVTIPGGQTVTVTNGQITVETATFNGRNVGPLNNAVINADGSIQQAEQVTAPAEGKKPEIKATDVQDADVGEHSWYMQAALA